MIQEADESGYDSDVVVLEHIRDIEAVPKPTEVIDLTSDNDDNTYIVSITKIKPSPEIINSVSSIIQHEKEYGHYNGLHKNIYNVQNTNFEWDKICPICKSKNELINFDVAICINCSGRFVFGRFHTDVMELCRDHSDTHATKCDLPLYFMTFDNQYLFCYCNECTYLSYID